MTTHPKSILKLSMFLFHEICTKKVSVPYFYTLFEAACIIKYVKYMNHFVHLKDDL